MVETSKDYETKALLAFDTWWVERRGHPPTLDDRALYDECRVAFLAAVRGDEDGMEATKAGSILAAHALLAGMGFLLEHPPPKDSEDAQKAIAVFERWKAKFRENAAALDTDGDMIGQLLGHTQAMHEKNPRVSLLRGLLAYLRGDTARGTGLLSSWALRNPPREGYCEPCRVAMGWPTPTGKRRFSGRCVRCGQTALLWREARPDAEDAAGFFEDLAQALSAEIPELERFADAEEARLAERPIALKVQVPSEQVAGYVHEPGARGFTVEKLGENAWLVEIRVPDESLEGDAWYDVLEVRPHEIEFLTLEAPEDA